MRRNIGVEAVEASITRGGWVEGSDGIQGAGGTERWPGNGQGMGGLEGQRQGAGEMCIYACVSTPHYRALHGLPNVPRCPSTPFATRSWQRCRTATWWWSWATPGVARRPRCPSTCWKMLQSVGWPPTWWSRSRGALLPCRLPSAWRKNGGRGGLAPQAGG